MEPGANASYLLLRGLNHHHLDDAAASSGFCIFPVSDYSQRSSQHQPLKTRVTHVPLLSPSPRGCHLIQPKPLRTPGDAPHHTGTHGALRWALYTPSTHGSQGLCSSSPSFWNTLLPDPRDSRPVRLHLWSRGSFSLSALPTTPFKMPNLLLNPFHLPPPGGALYFVRHWLPPRQFKLTLSLLSSQHRGHCSAQSNYSINTHP